MFVDCPRNNQQTDLTPLTPSSFITAPAARKTHPSLDRVLPSTTLDISSPLGSSSRDLKQVYTQNGRLVRADRTGYLRLAVKQQLEVLKSHGRSHLVAGLTGRSSKSSLPEYLAERVQELEKRIEVRSAVERLTTQPTINPTHPFSTERSRASQVG